jgi:hypothetical protein
MDNSSKIRRQEGDALLRDGVVRFLPIKRVVITETVARRASEVRH